MNCPKCGAQMFGPRLIPLSHTRGNAIFSCPNNDCAHATYVTVGDPGIPKRKKSERINTSFSCKPELSEKLRIAAEERNLSMSYLINRALEDYLSRLIPVEKLTLTRDIREIREDY